MAKKPNRLTVETRKHEKATRKNIPTAEYQAVMKKKEQNPYPAWASPDPSSIMSEASSNNLPC